MPKRRGRPKKSEINIKSDETKLVFALIFGLFAAFSFLSFFNEGEVFSILKTYFGNAVIPIGILSLAVSARLFGMEAKFLQTSNLFGLFLVTLAITALLHVGIEEFRAFEEAELGNGGGLVGYFVSSRLIDAVSRNGALVTIILFIFVGTLIFTGTSLSQLKEILTASSEKLKEIQEKMAERREERLAKLEEEAGEEGEGGAFVGALSGKDRIKRGEEEDQDKAGLDEAQQLELEAKKAKKKGEGEEKDELFGEEKFPNWKLPALSILEESEDYKVDPKIQRKNSEIIEQTLKSFGIQAKVVDVVTGPTVSQYALSISVGTKVSRIKNLDNDIALALAAPSGKVRIDAPIPGTSLVGIEVPNESKAIVKLRSLVEHPDMQNKKYRLPIPVGLDVAGKPIIKDLSRMPHLLVAGQTGAGKSVAINAILTGLLMRHSPDSLRFIMVDPKRVELSDYNRIPHLLHPVIERPDKVANALDWTLGEMSRRYDLFTEVRARNIETYNQYKGFTALPYIVVVIDEMADLMMLRKIDVESKVVRIAQMARATGIHLVLSTQRPSVDVVTGLIKANIPARIALTVATSIDSRVIIDSQGAENLLGNGDMLLITAEMNKPLRVQGVMCEEKEIKKVLDHVEKQASKEEPEYIEDVTKAQPTEGATVATNGDVVSDDPLFKEAVGIVVSSQKASASMLQRKLSIGYNRAARLIDEMEEAGIVGEGQGSKPRKVLTTDPSLVLPSKEEK